MREIETPAGLARAELRLAREPAAALVLGHGAAGGIGARDLLATAEVATSMNFSVALVEQPYRVAGKRSPAPARQLDAAWVEVLAALSEDELKGVRLIAGGRSAGARVACRTAAATRAAGVLCLAFPLLPPRRASGNLATSRQDELDGVSVPVLIVQGHGDPFGVPPPGPNRRVVTVAGNHALTSDLDAVRGAVREWLTDRLGRGRSR